MRSQCVHHAKNIRKIHQLKQTSQWNRCVSTSSPLYQEETKDGKDNQKTEDTTGSEKGSGFFARFKQEFMKDMKDIKKDKTNKESIDAIQAQTRSMQNQYNKYIGSKLPKFKAPESLKEKIPSENFSKEKLSEKAENLKSRFQKERLAEDYHNFIENAKLQSQASLERMKEWQKKPEKESESEEPISNEPPKPSRSSIFKSKMNHFVDRSGLSETAYYKQVKDQASSVVKENTDFVSGMREDVLTKSKEWKETVAKQSQEFGRKVEDLSKKVTDETIDAVEKSGIIERSKETYEKSEKLAKETAERIAHEKEELLNSEKLKKATEATQETIKTAAEDFYSNDGLKGSEIYRSPEQLKKRIDDDEIETMKAKAEEDAAKIKIDEATTGVTEHKGFKWDQTWKNFKEQNPLVQKLMQFRENLEESDNLLARAGYKVFDTFSSIVTGMMQPNEISTTIAEIQKMDPDFDITKFATTLRFDIVPNVLEAYLRKDVVILENWCQERAIGQFKHMLAAREFTGKIQLIDIGDCEILTGCMLELGPVFMFNVHTQQMYSKINKTVAEGGEVSETAEDTIKQVVYTIAVCRDQTMLDPTAAWTVLEIIEHVTNEKYF